MCEALVKLHNRRPLPVNVNVMFSLNIFVIFKYMLGPSRGGLEVERSLHKRRDSALVVIGPKMHQCLSIRMEGIFIHYLFLTIIEIEKPRSSIQ